MKKAKIDLSDLEGFNLVSDFIQTDDDPDAHPDINVNYLIKEIKEHSGSDYTIKEVKKWAENSELLPSDAREYLQNAFFLCYFDDDCEIIIDYLFN